MAQIPLTLSEIEGHFCSYDWQCVSHSASAFAELLLAVSMRATSLFYYWYL